MRRVELRPRAVRDLDESLRFSTDRWDEEQTDRYLRTIMRELELLAAFPGIGSLIEDICSDYRKHHVGKHLLFYRAEKDLIDVARIIHASCDYDDPLFEF